MNHWLTFFVLYQSVVPNGAEFLVYLIKGSVVVGLTAGLTVLLRKRSALSRNWAWRAALISLAVLGFWKFGPQGLIPYRPNWQVMPELSVIQSVATSGSFHPGHHNLMRMPSFLLLGLVALSDRYIPTVWVAGIAGCLLWRTGRATIGAWWLKKSSRPAPADLQRAANETAASIHAQHPQVAICRELVTPLLTGVFRPAIFLPVESSGWKPEKLRAVLLHEMAHWQRSDLFWQGFAAIVTALWWWNPLVWMAARKLRAEAEQAADDVVILNRHGSADYAQALMEIAASASGQNISTGIAMIGRSSLETRVRQLLVNNPARGKIHRLALTFALALTCATIGLGGFYLTLGIGRGAVDNDSVSVALHDAQKLMREGKNEEALQKFLWYWEASKTSPGQGGVRVSFALSYWIDLGKKYPPAQAALLSIRDANEKAIQAGTADFQMFQEYASINDNLQQSDRTYATYETVRARNPKQADQYFYVMRDQLVAHHQYQICSAALSDAGSAFENIQSGRQTEIQVSQNPRFGAQKAFFLKSADQRFERDVRQLIEILVGAQRMPDAEAVQKKALATLDTPTLRSAITDAQQRVAAAGSPVSR